MTDTHIETSKLNLSFRQDGHPGNLPRTCDICHLAACSVYCQNDSAYLCHSCNEFIHSSPTCFLHDRVWICNACEIAPASFACQGHGASLCINCEIEIHIADPLACCHNLAPVTPFPGTEFISSVAYLEDSRGPMSDMENLVISDLINYREFADEIDSWSLLDLAINGLENDYLDIVNNQEQLRDIEHVPVPYSEAIEHEPTPQIQEVEQQQQQQQQPQQLQDEREYEAQNGASNDATSPPKVPMSIMDPPPLSTATMSKIQATPPSIIPETISDPSPKPSDLISLNLPTSNRAAKLQRYREKKKSRKFDKKIRYVSRKTNAEIRPRVNGRFVRKTELHFEMDQMGMEEDYMFMQIVPSYLLQ